MRCTKFIMRYSIVVSNMLRFRTCFSSISHFNVNPWLLLVLELKEMNVLHAWNHFWYFQVSCQQQLTYVDPVKTFYALNPQNNLPNTQKMFQKWFERYELWNTQIVEQFKKWVASATMTATRMGLLAKQFCSLFGTFWWRPFHQYNVKPRVENVYGKKDINTRWRIFLFLLGYSR